VGTGAVHLLPLKAIPSNGELADSLPNDHEGNLYLKGWGMANEPVYNQQGTAYLLRDDAKAAIRTLYSSMASAFSHSAFEPVEHRWTHGQYFGPPSTDGAWVELYRNMLFREMDDHTLLVALATPRKWLEDGRKLMSIERRRISVRRLSRFRARLAPAKFWPTLNSKGRADRKFYSFAFVIPNKAHSLRNARWPELERLRYSEGVGAHCESIEQQVCGCGRYFAGPFVTTKMICNIGRRR